MRISGYIKRTGAILLVFLILVSFFIIMPVLPENTLGGIAGGEKTGGKDDFHNNTTGSFDDTTSDNTTYVKDMNTTISRDVGRGFADSGGISYSPGSSGVPGEPLSAPEFPAFSVPVMMSAYLLVVLLLKRNKK